MYLVTGGFMVGGGKARESQRVASVFCGSVFLGSACSAFL